MLLVASRNSRVPPIERCIYYAYRLFGMIQRTATIIRHTHVYVCTCIHRLLPTPRIFAEKEARSRVLVATERKERGRNDMHRKSDLPKRKRTVCVNVCVFLNIKLRPVKCRRIKKNL